MNQRRPGPSSRRAVARCLLALGLAVALGGAAAAPAANPPAVFESAQRGPWVPATAVPRGGATQAAPTRGAALQSQAEAKLRADFDAIATQHGGRLTRAQAEAAGLGYVARHFDRIDRRGAGAVRFEDLQQYSRQRAAELAR